MDVLIYPLSFFVLLGILVTIHELGHYVVARCSGVQILKFSVGFGRAIWSKTDKRGTEWVLAMIPFGGYVRMLDDREPGQAALNHEKDHEKNHENEFAYMDLHPKWRIAIALGGPLANFLLAILVFSILQLAGSYKVPPMTALPEAGTPLANAGLTAPAELLAIDGVTTGDWERVALALTRRLGETGTIALEVRPFDQLDAQVLDLRIDKWHQAVGDPDVVRSLGLIPSLQPLIGEIVPDTPASAAGLRQGDWIVAANGEPLANWSALVAVIEANPNKNIQLRLVRNGTTMQVSVRPGVRDDDRSKGFLGVGFINRFVGSTWSEVLPNALAETWDKSALILSVLGKMFTGDVSVKNLSGPISIAQVAGDSAQYGWRQFFGILAFLSISLGVLNLLPIPILDGGHIIFSSVEWLWGKPVPEQVQIWGVQIGLVLVGSLMVFATYNDVLRLF